MSDPIAYTKFALQDEWEETIQGRQVDVPEPYIISQREDKRFDVSRRDVIIIKDGGIVDKSPGTIGYNEQTSVFFVNIDIRTVDRDRENLDSALRSPGSVRLNGFRDDMANTQDRYGGLLGEVERVIHTVRRGTNEFDRIQIVEANDLSDQSGSNHYRAVVTVRFENTLDTINPDP